MRRLFIGHRGVGKTALLHRHKDYYPEVKHFDLDSEIEKNINSTIFDIFKNKGEAEFRKIELDIFEKLVSSNKTFVISLGAGFELDALDKSSYDIIFVQRVTDRYGRIFLNRPRLTLEENPIQEYKNIYKKRHDKYFLNSKRTYYLPEGIDQSNDIEKKILSNDFNIRDAFYTLTLNDVDHLDETLNLYKKIELRSDLLNKTLIDSLLNTKNCNNEWLLSIRSEIKLEVQGNVMIDCDVQFLLFSETAAIVSSHNDDINKGILELSEHQSKILKLCPLINTMEELRQGHHWQQLDPINRNFLPRSSDSKWIWYRQLSKYLQKINFVKGLTDNRDQPSAYQWLILPEVRPTYWGAVLGNPIDQSRSPIRHELFFKIRKSYFTSIQLNSNNFEQDFLFLRNLGLCYIAVTSPLKQRASLLFETTKALDESINTIFASKEKHFTTNTDLVGFQFLANEIPADATVAIWGGGGTLQVIKDSLPNADFYSSRTGLLRSADKESMTAHGSYDFLIWAAPRLSETSFPKFKVKKIIDLNYAENSLGLEFAQRAGIEYKNGLEMFNIQAAEQQSFWSMNERK